MAAPPNPDTTKDLMGYVLAIVGFISGVVTILWNGVNYFRQKKKDLIEEETWKSRVEATVEELRTHIEHYKEMEALRHKAVDDRLLAAEKRLEEVLSLLIEAYQDDGQPPSARRNRR